MARNHWFRAFLYNFYYNYMKHIAIRHIGRTVAFLLLLPLLCRITATAQGNLLITPRRIVFENDKKTQELNLANTGTDTARYVISMVEMRMKEDGSFEQITQPDSAGKYASDYVRFFPHSVTLAPNEAQVVKMQVLRTAAMKEGEYRSHIYFRAVPQANPLGEEPVADAGSGIAVQLTPVFGISLPVIIRKGPSATEVKLADVQYHTPAEGSNSNVSMVLRRSGNMSVYGDVLVDFTPAAGKAVRVAEVRGVAVYTSTDSRKLVVNLDQRKVNGYGKGTFHISYVSASLPAENNVLARTELLMP